MSTSTALHAGPARTGLFASLDNRNFRWFVFGQAAFVHEIVGPDRLHNAVSLNSAVFRLGALAGPAVSTGLITALGTGWAFIATGRWYLIVLGAFLAIRHDGLRAALRLTRAKGQQRMALAEIRRRPTPSAAG